MQPNAGNASQKVTIWGLPTITAESYNATHALITLRSDVEYASEHYTNVPVLLLSIERFRNSDTVFATDSYLLFLPRLKFIPQFRSYVDVHLGLFSQRLSSDKFVREGIAEYLKELRTYSDTVEIVRQARHAVGWLSADQLDAQELAKAVLSALGHTPHMDIPFEVKS